MAILDINADMHKLCCVLNFKIEVIEESLWHFGEGSTSLFSQK